MDPLTSLKQDTELAYMGACASCKKKECSLEADGQGSGSSNANICKVCSSHEGATRKERTSTVGGATCGKNFLT